MVLPNCPVGVRDRCKILEGVVSVLVQTSAWVRHRHQTSGRVVTKDELPPEMICHSRETAIRVRVGDVLAPVERCFADQLPLGVIDLGTVVLTQQYPLERAGGICLLRELVVDVGGRGNGPWLTTK